ncbi:dipeptidyl aminopeptidase [Streptococcus suis]|uniref:dipeptidyl aminopeptidase n=1 Tax=Streptococcus suis TaxID=1307 RepID=UPI00041CAEF8|nr:dipeptidyl aminopeptidase [Streptococcus suis]AZR97651.1 dipeptidyl aminopeptidase [Streptococcus suis]KPA67092.1 dipeptidyl aminopeptidase [Streptococcus suis]HEM3181489.1 dipeptidyl aminopeptidase [Streptococcus suis 89-5259]
MKHHFFSYFPFEFEATRVLWYAPYGGADYAEVARICEKIKARDAESWYREWSEFGNNLIEEINKNQSVISKGKAYLRASRYFQAAEFFLHPTDKRKLEAYEKSVAYFYQGLDLLSIPYEQYPVQYQGKNLRTLLFKPQNGSPKGTFFVCGGFDALLEELYFTSVVPALEQGYQVILFEGPGQSHLIRYENCPFTADWGSVCQAVVDAYDQRGQVISPTIGLGLSLGGLLMARAVSARPKLFDKVVLFNYFPSLVESFKISIPKFLHPYVEKGFPVLLEKGIEKYISRQFFLNWQIKHAKWVFGADNLNDLLRKASEFTEVTFTTDGLIFLSEGDNYYDYHMGLDFFNQLPSKNKQLVVFHLDSVSSRHCQNGASYVTNNHLFDWLLDERLNE